MSCYWVLLRSWKILFLFLWLRGCAGGLHYPSSKNPATQGNISEMGCERWPVTKHISLSFSQLGSGSQKPIKTHIYALTLETMGEFCHPCCTKESSLSHSSFFFLIAAYSISRFTAAPIQHCSSLARVCQAHRGLRLWSEAQYPMCEG